MRTVWKFEIDVADRVVEQLPAGAEVIHVEASEHAGMWLWAIVDTEAPREQRVFAVRGTGQELGEVGAHIATVSTGLFVWHLFEGAA